MTSDTATAKELKDIAREGERRPISKRMPLTRRLMYQIFASIDRALERSWSIREAARHENHLDDVQHLTEAIFHLKRALAHLNYVSLRRFNRRAEDLKVYQ